MVCFELHKKRDNVAKSGMSGRAYRCATDRFSDNNNNHRCNECLKSRQCLADMSLPDGSISIVTSPTNNRLIPDFATLSIFFINLKVAAEFLGHDHCCRGFILLFNFRLKFSFFSSRICLRNSTISCSWGFFTELPPSCYSSIPHGLV